MPVVTVYHRDKKNRPIGALVGIVNEKTGSFKTGWSLVAACDRKNARKSLSRQLAAGRALLAEEYDTVPIDIPFSFHKNGTLEKFMQVVREAFKPPF